MDAWSLTSSRYGRRSPAASAMTFTRSIRRTGAPFANVCRSRYPNSVLGPLLRAKSNSTSLQLCCRMCKSHSVVVIKTCAQIEYWSLLIKSGDRFRTLWLAKIGQRRSFGWILNNGRRRRILLQTKCGDVQAVYAFLDSTSSVFDCFSADGLVAQLVHRARPIEGGSVASQCVSCHARPVPLARALASHRLVRAGRRTRCRYMCKV